MEQQKEIIVFGGSFNPPTLAHQAIIAACLDAPGFDEVWVMPSGERRDKCIATASDDRLSMLRAMKQTEFQDNPRLHISDFEMQLPLPTQTARTAGALALRHSEARFWFVFGADSYESMPSWQEGALLQQTLPMLLVKREGYALPPESDHVRQLSVGPEYGLHAISSTDVRERVAQQLSIAAFVCQAVGKYIERSRLYTPS